MPSDGLKALHPRQSLRRLKTTFSPSSPTRSESAASTLSPTSASPSSRFSGFSFGNLSAASLNSSSGSRRVIRRKKSAIEVEQEEEQRIDESLVGLIEPRPYAGPTLGGIEEVLDGRI